MWRCPACRTPIDHAPSEAEPRPGAIYRCHVCRLELALDPKTNKLVAAPLNAEDRRTAVSDRRIHPRTDRRKK